MLRHLATALAAGVSLLVLGAGPAQAAGAPATPGAREAVLYDPAAGTFMLSRAGDRQVAVGSLVKLMTARLVLEAGDLGAVVTVPQGVTLLPETKAGLVPGERLSESDLLAALLIRSANDAALSLATALAGGEPAFALRMNAEAARLGLNETRYVNSSGLDAPGQWSSAHDVALLAAADMGLAGFAPLVARTSVTMPGGQVYRTVNPFLAYYPGATGVKTGFTSDALFCLAASAERGGHTLIAVVLGEPSWASADQDAGALLNWGFTLLPTAATTSAAASSAASVGTSAGVHQSATGPSTAAPPSGSATTAAAAPPPAVAPAAAPPRSSALPSPQPAAPARSSVLAGGQPAAPARSSALPGGQPAAPAAPVARGLRSTLPPRAPARASASILRLVWPAAAAMVAALLGWAAWRRRGA